MKKMTYTIGIIGLGTVGSGVYRQLKKKAAYLAKRTGVRIRIKAVCDSSMQVIHQLGLKKHQSTRSYHDIINDPDIQCVVELVGGTSIAKTIILEAFKKGKDVVTANKALLAECGKEIFAAAKKQRRRIMYEASVGGGIPIIKGLTEALISNHVSSILSIINGTCNYILTKMTEEGMEFKEALRLAQEKGYAEANPSLDIKGIDAAHKIVLLAELAFQKKINFHEVSCHGITRITQADIAFARELGYVIKLLAIAKKSPKDIEVRVEPTLIPRTHILANVNNSYNAVYLTGDEVGNMLFYGRGAGARPTASAVVSDILDLARNVVGMRQALMQPQLESIHLKAQSSLSARYYVRFLAIDRPGVLAKIASIFGRYKVSISDVIQKERKHGRAVPLVLLTHETHEAQIRHAVTHISTLSVVKPDMQVMRMEE